MGLATDSSRKPENAPAACHGPLGVRLCGTLQAWDVSGPVPPRITARFIAPRERAGGSSLRPLCGPDHRQDARADRLGQSVPGLDTEGETQVDRTIVGGCAVARVDSDRLR
jgi:hypothetical protein